MGKSTISTGPAIQKLFVYVDQAGYSYAENSSRKSTRFQWVPSGKHTHNYGKSQCLMGKCHYKSPFSIAMLNYQWVNLSFSLSRDASTGGCLVAPLRLTEAHGFIIHWKWDEPEILKTLAGNYMKKTLNMGLASGNLLHNYGKAPFSS